MSDVPSPIDFHDPAQAKAWLEDTETGKPWRAEFFTAFVDAINRAFDRPVTILELGSGPGQLAEAIVKSCQVQTYTLLDFSAAMHDLAQARLAPFKRKIQFLQLDFTRPEWIEDLGPFDVVVTQQAVHELRQWQHAPALYWQAHEVLWDGGLFLVCDHYADGPSAKNLALYMTRADQKRMLESCGFERAETLLDRGEMTLHAARKWD
jgi:SAM-dependent methyltransferase